MKRKIIRNFINGEEVPLSKLDLTKAEIKTCWTIYNEDKMWNSNEFNPYTGKPIIKGVDLDGLVLQHEKGVFIEDQIDDWTARGNYFKYYTRVVKLGDKCDILVEYEEH